MALGLTQPLTEMSTRNISWVWRRPLRGSLNLLEPTRPYPGLYMDSFTVYLLAAPRIWTKMFVSKSTDMYMSYRWVSFCWKVTWQRHTESETRPSEIKSSITKTMLRHNEITHNAHPATRISLYDNSHRSHSNWNEGRQYLSKISHCPSQCCAWRGTVRSRRYNIATMSNVNCDVSNEILQNHVSYSPLTESCRIHVHVL